jgi:lipopolysaccharide transport system permease protein
MLLTPVVYPARTEGLAGWLATWNPISPLITTARECLTAQPLTLLPAFWIVTACAAIAAFLGLVLFRLAMPAPHRPHGRVGVAWPFRIQNP